MPSWDWRAHTKYGDASSVPGSPVNYPVTGAKPRPDTPHTVGSEACHTGNPCIADTPANAQTKY